MDSVSFKDGNLSAKLVPNGVLKGFMSVSEYCYDYNGSYTATPTNEEQIFETKEKRMADNFTVMPIPFDLSSDTVEPEKLLYNVTAHDKAGNAIVGTMPDNGVADGIISKKNDVYSVQEGYYEGGTVQISQDEQDKIVSDNIRDGITILGVAGSDCSSSVLDALITRNIAEISNNRVTSIGNYVFQDCSNLTTADFPLAITIGEYAFGECSNLTTVGLPLVTSTGYSAFAKCSNLTTVDLPSVTSIGKNTFLGCSSLTTVGLPLVTSIGAGAFGDCSNLTTVDFPLVTGINSSTFQRCSSLTTVDFPLVTSIEGSAFYECSNLTTVDFPLVTSIGSGAFYECSNLTTVDFPLVTGINNYTFDKCSNLTTVSLPLVTSIGFGAFRSCSNLTTVDFPLVESIGNYAFAECSNLTAINFPVVKSIGNNTFQGCSNLTTIDFPLATSIGTYTFKSCSNLTALILRKSDAICTISSTNAFNSTPFETKNGYIYVPSSLVEGYKSAKSWSNYADRIRAIEDYPEIAGG